MSFAIRTARNEDIPELRDLIEQSIRVLQQGDYTPAQMEGAIGHALGLDTQLIEDGTYFVAEAPESREIAGCGGWSMRKTLFGSNHGPHRSLEMLDPRVDAARIRAIFVHPRWARQGLGSLLLAHCEAVAQAAGFTRFQMGATLTGVPLYTQKGYVATERIEVPLPNGEVLPVISMCREIQGSH
jgi:GNAT superfamily N-acetyltransferase